jgi:hypothetical protein
LRHPREHGALEPVGETGGKKADRQPFRHQRLLLERPKAGNRMPPVIGADLTPPYP